MNFAVSKDTVIIGYSGESNGKEAWKIASSVSDKANEGATYISDLSAGKLIGVYRKDLSKALENIVGDNSNYIENIISGGYKDEFGNWIRLEGGSCGYTTLDFDNVVTYLIYDDNEYEFTSKE